MLESIHWLSMPAVVGPGLNPVCDSLGPYLKVRETRRRLTSIAQRSLTSTIPSVPMQSAMSLKASTKSLLVPRR